MIDNKTHKIQKKAYKNNNNNKINSKIYFKITDLRKQKG